MKMNDNEIYFQFVQIIIITHYKYDYVCYYINLFFIVNGI